MSSLHPQAFTLPFTFDGERNAATARSAGRSQSPAAALALLVASSFAIWLTILLLLLS